MHTYFRQYAQQMGMQNYRAILPEQIDILINTSISDVVNQIIRESVNVQADRIITDNSKLGGINALRSLYKVKEISINEMFKNGDNNGHMVHLVTTTDGLINSDLYNSSGTQLTKPKFLWIVDFAINYQRDSFTTSYYPVRIIDDMYLADVLNDFILAPRFRSPIMVIYKSESNDNDIQEYNLYIDRGSVTVGTDDISIALNNGLIPNNLRVSYISRPATVMYNEDNEGVSVDCDLPEYLHIDIVKHAVDLYHAALQGSMLASQVAQQQQQRQYPQQQQQQQQ